MSGEGIFTKVRKFVRENWKIIIVAMLLLGLLLSLIAYLRKKNKNGREP